MGETMVKSKLVAVPQMVVVRGKGRMVDDVPVIAIRHAELRDYLIEWFANPNAAIVTVNASQPVVAPGQPGRAATTAAVIQRGHACIRVHESRLVESWIVRLILGSNTLLLPVMHLSRGWRLAQTISFASTVRLMQ